MPDISPAIPLAAVIYCGTKSYQLGNALKNSVTTAGKMVNGSEKWQLACV
jgi:hypothetical protein